MGDAPTQAPSPSDIVQAARFDVARYEELYRHLHAHPELSGREELTAARIQRELARISPDLVVRNGIGGHGLAATLSNGPGPTVLLRADMDALPVLEQTGLPWASTARGVDHLGQDQPVMHACGHDMHMASLLGCVDLLTRCRASWRGTVVFAFQPSEERGTGAQSMVDDGLYTRHDVPVPDAVVGGHVVKDRAGFVGTRVGTFAKSCENYRVTFHGRGGHASMPESVVNPIVMAADAVTRISNPSPAIAPAPGSTSVCSILRAGGPAENVVADTAELTLDLRAEDEEAASSLRSAVFAHVHEAGASGVEAPTITQTRRFPATVNDAQLHAIVDASLRAHFGASYDGCAPRISFSEDFSILASAVSRPSLMFVYGGTDAGVLAELPLSAVPSNHSPHFAPAVQPTLCTAIEAYSVIALSLLAGGIAATRLAA
ncbi:unnamed protein product [Parajaminaea phylloscopi]